MKTTAELNAQCARILVMVEAFEKPFLAARRDDEDADFAARSAYAEELINGK